MEKVNKATYIMSLEASDIYGHSVRGLKLKGEYVGAIPYSLELIKLKSMKGFKVRKVKESEKEISDDLINVKFKSKLRSYDALLESLPNKIEYHEGKLAEERIKLAEAKNKKDITKFEKSITKREVRIEELFNLKERIEVEKDDEKWQEMSVDKLREHLYTNGFNIINEDGEFTHYVVYKRSSAKSRTGKVLMIKESLHNDMINWSRMGLGFKENDPVDLASLLAYESLVGSSLESTITINPNNILIVDDVESIFEEVCNVVRTVKKNGEDFLDSITENTTIKNSLFDGSSLLNSEYFEEGKGMMLLRNHMFKSAAFNTNLTQFLKDYANKNEIDFATWEIPNMYGEPMLASEIHMVITPSSLKALKFNGIGEIKTKQDMWNHWKHIVEEDGNVFGVCKHEKESKRGKDENGNILQRTSYQMLNSLPMNEEDMNELTEIETKYIEQLKNNDPFFVEYLLKNKTNLNSHEMFADLYDRNSDIVGTEIFRTYRASEVAKYVKTIRRGKVRLLGDYCVMIGNAVEYLYHAIGKFDVNKSKLTLSGNEIHTTLFDFNREYSGFRNPHTSPSNTFVGLNVDVEDINTYFNFSKNIVCINVVKHNVLNRLSGADFDSDNLVLFDSPKLLSLAQECQKYPVCVNDISGEPLNYKLNNSDMCTIDNKLSTSQAMIGTVTNTGQLVMSRYWDLKASGVSEVKLEGLMKKADIMTVLSGICIDLAKKFYKIDIEKEIRHVEQSFELKRNEDGKLMKPNFWQYVSGQNGTAKQRREARKKIKDKIIHYDTPMDFLFRKMSKLPKAMDHENVELLTLVVEKNLDNGDRKQEAKILNFVEEIAKEITNVHTSDNDKEEMNNRLEAIVKYYNFYVKKSTVKEDTMYAILLHMVKNEFCQTVRLMNTLHTTQREVFLNAFLQK